MSLFSKHLFTVGFLILPFLILAQSTAIVIDEDFSDWIPGLACYEDGIDNIGALDLIDMQVTNDADWLYIKWSMDSELDLTDNIIPHDLRIGIDTDNNSSTGWQEQSGYGTELTIHFVELYAWFDIPEPSQQVSLDNIKLRVLPTVSAKEFELAINRNVMPNGVDNLFSGSTIKIMIKDELGGDRMPNDGQEFSYTFDETPVDPFTPIDINKANPHHLRITAYNTLGGGMLNSSRQDNFESIITSLNPDIVGFSECGSSSDTQIKALMDVWLPLETEEGWHVLQSGDLVTCSKWPIVSTWALWKQFATLIDIPDIYGSDLLVTNAHLSCCGADGARQNQIDSYCSFILDAKSPGGEIDLPEYTPFVYIGDLNLVGFSQQLKTLVTGDIQNTNDYGLGGPLDWDNTDVTDQVAIQSDKHMAYTWRKDNEAYPPGRLDFQIYSDATMNTVKSFTLQTEVMSTERLELYGLNQFDTMDASDHFPVTVDYTFPPMVDTDNDLIPDSIDNCPEISNYNQNDWNEDGIGDSCQDSDNDGLSDEDEINIYNTDPIIQDSDGDGLTDGLEVTVDGIDPLSSDTDNDGCTDDLEFSLQCPDNQCNDCAGDLNDDGTVTISDLLLFLNNFGFVCD